MNRSPSSSNAKRRITSLLTHCDRFRLAAGAAVLRHPQAAQGGAGGAAAGHLQRSRHAAITRRRSAGASSSTIRLLTGLIGQALVGNQELRILNEDIRIANNEILARRAHTCRSSRSAAARAWRKPAASRREGAVEDQLTVAPGKGFPEPLPDFLVATNVSWEIDIWRKLRNASDAASLRYLGTARGAELHRHPLGRRGRRELLRAAGARQPAGDAGSNDRDPGAKPRNRRRPRRKRPAAPSWPSSVSRPKCARTRAKG